MKYYHNNKIKILLIIFAISLNAQGDTKPIQKERLPWVSLIPDLGLSVDGTPHITWSANKIMTYIRESDKIKYQQELEVWQDSVRTHRNKYLATLETLNLEKAINDSIYYDRLLSLTLLRYERGDVTDENLLNTRKGFYDSKYNLQIIRLKFSYGVFD